MYYPCKCACIFYIFVQVIPVSFKLLSVHVACTDIVACLHSFSKLKVTFQLKHTALRRDL